MSQSSSPMDVLGQALDRAKAADGSFLPDGTLAKRLSIVAGSKIRAGVRVILAGCLARICEPGIDIRKPFTELGAGSYSGRTYDERYIIALINANQLPCNLTTAFLTPALRTKPIPLTRGTRLGGRNREPYDSVIEIFESIESGDVDASNVLAETIRQLLRIRDDRKARIESLKDEIRAGGQLASLSSENVVAVLAQLLQLRGTSRLPVLIVVAAYHCAEKNLGERALPLKWHNAADAMTGALGDIEIALISEDRIVTVYEMKDRDVASADLERALQKISESDERIDNYIFITTKAVSVEVFEQSLALYAETGGIEFAILDCIGFIRHFLHLFHRIRADYLDALQTLVLDEPESSISHELKEAFLTLRQLAEAQHSELG